MPRPTCSWAASWLVPWRCLPASTAGRRCSNITKSRTHPAPRIVRRALLPSLASRSPLPRCTLVPGCRVRKSQLRRYAGEVMRLASRWQAIEHHPLSSGFRAANTSMYKITQMNLLANKTSELPKDFTWANVSGHSYLTPVRNQHIPTYCGSCWAFAPTSVLEDRYNVMTMGTGRVMPDLVLSTQNVLSCGNDLVGCGTCRGGDDAAVFKYAEQAGIPHESCSNYMATDTTCDAALPPEGNNRPPCYNCDEKGNAMRSRSTTSCSSSRVPSSRSRTRRKLCAMKSTKMAPSCAQ